MSTYNSSALRGDGKLSGRVIPRSLLAADLVYAGERTRESPAVNKTEVRTNTQGRLWVSHTCGIHMRCIHMCLHLPWHKCVYTHTCRNPLPHPHPHTSLMSATVSPERLSALRLLQASPELSSSTKGRESCAHLLGPVTAAVSRDTFSPGHFSSFPSVCPIALSMTPTDIVQFLW